MLNPKFFRLLFFGFFGKMKKGLTKPSAAQNIVGISGNCPDKQTVERYFTLGLAFTKYLLRESRRRKGYSCGVRLS